MMGRRGGALVHDRGIMLIYFMAHSNDNRTAGLLDADVPPLTWWRVGVQYLSGCGCICTVLHMCVGICMHACALCAMYVCLYLYNARGVPDLDGRWITAGRIPSMHREGQSSSCGPPAGEICCFVAVTIHFMGNVSMY